MPQDGTPGRGDLVQNVNGLAGLLDRVVDRLEALGPVLVHAGLEERCPGLKEQFQDHVPDINCIGPDATSNFPVKIRRSAAPILL